MRDRVVLGVRVPGKVPATYESRVVETTATPGVYVTEHPDEPDSWVLVVQCGKWLANYVRWKTPDDAHAVAAAIAEHGIDWTLTSDGELFKAHPDFADCYWATVEQFDDRRHPTAV